MKQDSGTGAPGSGDNGAARADFRERNRKQGLRPGLAGHLGRRPRCRAIPVGMAAASVCAWTVLSPTASWADLDNETGFVLGSLSFLFWGALVMWMCAGFTMLESGSVSTKNSSVICLKNIGLLSISVISYYLVGYNLMYVGVEPGGWLNLPQLFYSETTSEWALLKDGSSAHAVMERGHSAASAWIFQMVFVAATCSIVSGTLAERVRLWPFLLFVAILATVIYPLVGAWTWGGGWLGAWGFKDFAGSTVVHATGGWAALAGCLVVGPRRGKFRADGTIRRTPPNNIPNVALGIFIVWLGFLGFNGGSRLALSGAVDIVAVSQVIANSLLASFAGVAVSICLTRAIFGRVDPMASFNGVLGGLVAITAGPDIAEHHWAIAIGGVGGLVSTVGIRLLQRLKIDDEVGAIPVHMGAGVWGTLAVCIAAGGNPVVQLTGIIVIGIFVFTTSLLVWLAIDRLFGAQISEEVERQGQDLAELGIRSFPESMRLEEGSNPPTGH